MTFQDAVKLLAMRAGLTVHRWPANRFDAMADALALLRQNGYRPAAVIDCGSNCGQFATLVTAAFPDATLHLIEPQASCWPALDQFARERSGVHLHRVAVTEPGVTRVRMHRGGAATSTGAFVITADEPFPADLEADATTLDELFGATVERGHRPLLKLDVEGHEQAALRGARRLLEVVEVVIAEVQFFDVNGCGRPLFVDISLSLRACGFELYDVAALAARRRDRRLRTGDAIFVRRNSPLAADLSWD